MSSTKRGAPRGSRPAGDDVKEAPRRYGSKRTCEACGTSLSAYNPGPHCWRHGVGVPWRGPSSKPKLD